MTPRIQFKRKLGHLWQVLYGCAKGRQFYGYGATQAQATTQARKRWSAAQ
jgi:hypothetical protein